MTDIQLEAGHDDNGHAIKAYLAIAKRVRKDREK